MDIIIDIRALMGGKPSGVEVYLKNLLGNLFVADRENRYLLYANAFSAKQKRFGEFESGHVHVFTTAVPNKIMNLAQAVFNYPKIDRWISAKQKKLRDFKPDVVFIPDLRPISLSRDVKKILVVHDLSWLHHPEYFSLRSRIWHMMLKFRSAAEAADRIIAVSHFTAGDVIKTFKLPAEKISIVYEGVDPCCPDQVSISRKNEAIKKYGLPENYFLFLATLEPRKNLARLIEAYQIFNKTNQGKIKLVLAGIKNEKIFNKLRINVSNDIILTGFIDEEDKAAVYSMARAFIYPSLYEGFGLPLLEAMSAGTPVITSNVSSMPEICGAAALLADPYDTASIAEAMRRITDQRIIAELKAKMPELLKLYSWKKCAAETLALINSLA